MSSSSSEFELPAVSQQFYKQLYSDDSVEYGKFLNSKTPASVQELLQNDKFLNLFHSNEPGPTVDYDNLRANLAELEQFLKTNPNGAALVHFYETLFQLRSKWIIDGVKFETFNAYCRALHHYYVVSRQQANFHGDPNSPARIDYEKECDNFMNSPARAKMEAEFQTLRETYATSCKTLLDLKTSQDMWHFASILWELVKKYDTHMQYKKNLAEDLEKKRKADEKKAREKERLKQRNADNDRYQMGRPLVPQMDRASERTLMGWMREQMAESIQQDDGSNQ